MSFGWTVAPHGRLAKQRPRAHHHLLDAPRERHPNQRPGDDQPKHVRARSVHASRSRSGCAWWRASTTVISALQQNPITNSAAMMYIVTVYAWVFGTPR